MRSFHYRQPPGIAPITADLHLADGHQPSPCGRRNNLPDLLLKLLQRRLLQFLHLLVKLVHPLLCPPQYKLSRLAPVPGSASLLSTMSLATPQSSRRPDNLVHEAGSNTVCILDRSLSFLTSSNSTMSSGLSTEADSTASRRRNSRIAPSISMPISLVLVGIVKSLLSSSSWS